MALFAAPEGAKRRDNGYSGWSPVDRTNDGKGYSEEELDQMIFVTGESRHEFKNWTGKKAFLKKRSSWITTKLDPAIGPTRHKTAYVENTLHQIQSVRGSVERHKTGIEGQIQSFEHDIRSHLWVTEDFMEPASEGLVQRLDEAKKLLARLAAVEKGYESLPREEEPEIVAQVLERRA